MTHPHEDIHRKIKEMAEKGYDVILIDCPPGASQVVASKDSQTSISRMAILAADVVIVPVRPSMLDYLASHQLLPLLKDVAALKENQKVLIAVNGKAATGRRNRSRWWTCWQRRIIPAPCTWISSSTASTCTRRWSRTCSTRNGWHWRTAATACSGTCATTTCSSSAGATPISSAKPDR